MEPTPGEGSVNIVEVIVKDLQYYTHLVDKPATEIERIDSNCERNSTVGKMLLNNMTCCREIIQERSQSIQQT